MAKAGIFDGLDAMLDAHLGSRFGTSYGLNNMGLVSVQFTFHGQTAHSAGSPWLWSKRSRRGHFDGGRLELRPRALETRAALSLHRSHEGGDQPNASCPIAHPSSRTAFASSTTSGSGRFTRRDRSVTKASSWVRKLFAGTILDLLLEPAHLDAVRAQFEEDAQDVTWTSLIPEGTIPPIGAQRRQDGEVSPLARGVRVRPRKRQDLHRTARHRLKRLGN